MESELFRKRSRISPHQVQILESAKASILHDMINVVSLDSHVSSDSRALKQSSSQRLLTLRKILCSYFLGCSFLFILMFSISSIMHTFFSVFLPRQGNHSFGGLILAIFCLLAMLSYFFSTLAAFAVLLIKDVWATREFAFYRSLVMLSSTAIERHILEHDARPDTVQSSTNTDVTDGTDGTDDKAKATRNGFRSFVLSTLDVIPCFIALIAGLVDGGLKQSTKVFFFSATVIGLFHVCAAWLLYLILDYKVKLGILIKMWREDGRSVLNMVLNLDHKPSYSKTQRATPVMDFTNRESKPKNIQNPTPTKNSTMVKVEVPKKPFDASSEHDDGLSEDNASLEEMESERVAQKRNSEPHVQKATQSLPEQKVGPPLFKVKRMSQGNNLIAAGTQTSTQSVARVPPLKLNLKTVTATRLGWQRDLEMQDDEDDEMYEQGPTICNPEWWSTSRTQLMCVSIGSAFAIAAVLSRIMGHFDYFLVFVGAFMMAFLALLFLGDSKEQHFDIAPTVAQKPEQEVSKLDVMTVFLDLYNGMTRSAILRFATFVASFSTMYMFLFTALEQYIAIAVFGSVYVVCSALYIALKSERALPAWLTLFSFSIVFSIVSLCSVYIVLGLPAMLLALCLLFFSQFYFMRLPKTFSSVFTAVFITFFLVSGLVYSIGSIQDFAPTRVSQARSGTLASPVDYPYSVCFSKWQGLSVLDYGFMSSLTYAVHSPSAFEEDFAAWFGHTDFVVVHNETSTVSFVDFYSPSRNLSVVAVRGTAVPLDVIQDMDIWLDALLIQTLSSLGPFAGVWPDGLISEIIYATSVMNRISSDTQQSSAYYHRVHEYVSRISDRSVMLTGHSLGGGVSNIVAAKTKRQAVTFSSPGVQWISKKVGIQDMRVLPFASTVIVPERDVVPMVDQHGGAQHAIVCTSAAAKCHSLPRTLYSLVNNCGDPYLRGIEPPK